MPETKPVAVECKGIVQKSGFTLSPVGVEPKYFEFEPGKTTEMGKTYAEYLVAQDPNRFFVVEMENADTQTNKDSQQKTNTGKPSFADKMKAAKAAKAAAKKKQGG